MFEKSSIVAAMFSTVPSIKVLTNKETVNIVHFLIEIGSIYLPVSPFSLGERKA